MLSGLEPQWFSEAMATHSSFHCMHLLVGYNLGIQEQERNILWEAPNKTHNLIPL